MTVNMSSAPKAAWQALGFCKRQSALSQTFGFSTWSLDGFVDLAGLGEFEDLTGLGYLITLSIVLAGDGCFAGLLLKCSLSRQSTLRKLLW